MVDQKYPTADQKYPTADHKHSYADLPPPPLEEHKLPEGFQHEPVPLEPEELTSPTPSVDETEPTFRTKAKRHCARWWWLHLLVGILIFLIILLPIIYVAVPKIAQQALDKAKLNITSEELTDPRPDSFHIALNSTVHSSSPFKPILKSFNASLYIGNGSDSNAKPFAYVTIPQMKVNPGDNVMYLEQDVSIANMDAFVAYSKQVLGSEEFQMAIKGRPGLKLGGLPTYTLNFKQVVTQKGLNKLSGFAINNITLPTNETDGANLLGIVTMQNPTLLALTLGNVTMDLYVNGEKIGTSLIPHVALEPEKSNAATPKVATNTSLAATTGGTPNTFALRGWVDLGKILSLATLNYTNMILPVDVLGQDVRGAQNETLSYFTSALKATPIRYDLDVGKVITNLVNSDLNQVGLATRTLGDQLGDDVCSAVGSMLEAMGVACGNGTLLG
ncbi:hypothetical protein IWZ00DRAFT_446412 [Phyllosticta capitalensis]|uniref:Uncharacterized protein n=1 Tax=Phyllosticta capitalensis TaxID=121624 RepID=A0ABR1YDM2_9PEZI